MGLGYSSRTYLVQSLQWPSRPAEKVPMAQSTHWKPNLIVPVDRQTIRATEVNEEGVRQGSIYLPGLISTGLGPE